MYASLLISLLAAFIAMLGKQWLNRYLRNAGGSMIERCGDRQRKCDGLQKWPFNFFIEILPIMLQISLLLLSCGLCQHVWSLNTSVASILIALTALGVLFYLVIVVVGTSSYACPFQTPVSTALRNLWKKIGHQITSALHSTASIGFNLYQRLSSTMLHLWKLVKDSTTSAFLHPVLPDEEYPRVSQQPGSLPQEPNRPTQELVPLPVSLPEGLSTPAPRRTEPWLEPTALAALWKKNANDVQCVSWILWSITDPEALDVAIRFASIILWFENGLDVKPPYDIIISTLEGCFDSAGKVYPGSRDRAYYSALAVLWIHIRAMCVSRDFALKFPLPTITCDTTSLDDDLRDLLKIYDGWDIPCIISWMYNIRLRFTPAYLQWTSNALLHLTWTGLDTPGIFDSDSWNSPGGDWETIPLNVVLNRLLTFCLFLGLPVEEEVLKVQDKS